MGGMAVRDGSFLLDGAVFSIDCGAGRNTLADCSLPIGGIGCLTDTKIITSRDSKLC